MLIGDSANVNSGSLNFATAIGSNSIVSTSNTIALGRSDTSDTVLAYGLVQLNTLATGGGTQLCRNASNQISSCSSSSIRYKTNVAPFNFGLSFVNQLRPVSYDWKDGGMRDVGFIAEEIEKINPLFVNYNQKGEVEGVKYDRLSVAFVNAFKE